LFPADDKYIPSMSDLHCSNYFDPNTGHLYLLIKKKTTCDIKTQPVVILKLGITVPENEFFNEDKIIGNIAGLLGIPLNKIRITNIVREGSVRRKRSTGESQEFEFQIADPPVLKTESDFVEPLEVGTTPADPNEPTAATTTPGTTSTTTAEFEIPSEKLDFGKLVAATSTLTTLLQSGKLSESLGVNVNSMEASKPIEPPEEEPEYTNPEDRSKVLEKTFAELSAEADQQKLEEMNSASDIKIPKNLVIERKIYEAEEMTKMQFYPYLRMTTTDGEKLDLVGGPGDPWLVTASLVSGPEGAEVAGNVTVPFVKGFANFTELLFTKMGPGYSVKFDLTYPTDIAIAAATSDEFSVEPRPLGLIIEDLSEQVPENEDLPVKYHIYDLGLGEKATPEVIGNLTWECTLGWPITVPVVIDGQRVSTIEQAGNNTGEFMVKFKNSKTSVALEAECSAREVKKVLTGRSSSFNIYPGTKGESGLFSLQTTAIKYTGPFTFIKAVIDAIPPIAVKDCQGTSCSEITTTTTTTRRRRAIARAKTVLNLAGYQEMSNPVCIRPNGTVECH